MSMQLVWSFFFSSLTTTWISTYEIDERHTINSAFNVSMVFHHFLWRKISFPVYFIVLRQLMMICFKTHLGLSDICFIKWAPYIFFSSLHQRENSIGRGWCFILKRMSIQTNGRTCFNLKLLLTFIWQTFFFHAVDKSLFFFSSRKIWDRVNFF